MHERLMHMKEALMCAVENQMHNLNQVDTKELGEAIDMIKDLEEAIYYCTITEAMNKGGQEHEQAYFGERYPYKRDMDRPNGKMYYPYDGGMMYYNGNGNSSSNGNTSSNNSSNGNTSSRNYSEREWPMEMYDYREGRSPKNRKMYMEAKETHQDKATQLRELEKYMQELSQDITEMIGDASTEEKQYLEKKLTTLASKVSQMK